MSSYNVNFINPLLDAVLKVLSTMAGVEVKPATPYLNKNGKAVGDITGQIAIEGFAQGVIAVSLSKSVILKIVNNMLFENYTEINDDIADAVGELTNMISGHARSSLSEMGMTFQASTPSVVTGKGKPIAHIPAAPILSIPFTSDDGDLVVEISLADPE
ncbi:chemotaxis protein CheX [Desulfoplanes formicivorans]|uniref:Chemotaxis protein X n=1 Tax=Desulfoplanes formicivorans TaxID=1592317 RepID=A0A194AGM5_9BACT|nr:chemotaxis protein CheX [Desulfoplanes formicivorans]GAU09227.1 chemotaxis protein X [Desulfoplanes formicivorans]